METTEDWDKIRERVVEQPSQEDNGNFLQRLVIEIRGQMGWDDNTSMFCCRVSEFGCRNLGGHD